MIPSLLPYVTNITITTTYLNHPKTTLGPRMIYPSEESDEGEDLVEGISAMDLAEAAPDREKSILPTSTIHNSPSLSSSQYAEPHLSSSPLQFPPHTYVLLSLPPSPSQSPALTPYGQKNFRRLHTAMKEGKLEYEFDYYSKGWGLDVVKE